MFFDKLVHLFERLLSCSFLGITWSHVCVRLIVLSGQVALKAVGREFPSGRYCIYPRGIIDLQWKAPGLQQMDWELVS